MAPKSIAPDVFDLEAETPSKPPPKLKQDVFDLPNDKKTWVEPPPPSTTEQIGNAPGLFVREGAAGLYALPSITAESYRYLAGKLQGLGEEQALEQGRELSEEEKKFTSNVVNYIPDLIKHLGEEFPSVFPTYEEARKFAGEQLEKNTGQKLPEKGRGVIEKLAEGGGKALPIAVFPASAAVKGAAIGTSALTEALDLSEKGKLIGNLSVPALTSIIESIVRRRYTPPRGVAQQLYEEGQRLGMTDAQLAPILATEGQVQRHGGLASSVRQTREAFQDTGQVLGNVIEDMQNRPQNLNALPANVEHNFVNRLQDIATDIRGRTHSLSPQETTLVEFIETAINDIQQNGSSPRQLIGLARSVNRIGAGRTELRRIMQPINEALTAVDPILAQDFQSTNQLYSRYIRNLEEINPSQFNAFVNAGELNQLVGAVFSGEASTLGKSLARFGGVNILRRISSSILTNPRAQSLVRNFGRAVRDGREASARAVAVQLKEYIKKELPEDYDKIDWDQLEVKD